MFHFKFHVESYLIIEKSFQKDTYFVIMKKFVLKMRVLSVNASKAHGTRE